MKKLLLLLFIAVQTFYAQDKISFGVFQDARLLISDDDYGNTAPTLDLIFNMDWEGKQFTYYYFSIKSQYEQANLQGTTFRRYTINTMWNLNRLFIPKLEAHLGVGIGMIHRKPLSAFTYSATSELTYPLFKRIRIALKYEYVRRNDLETPQFKHNGAVGIQWEGFKL